MARMASRPRIGAIIRDAMERKRLDQIRVAEALGVSRSAVNAWINDRSWPMNSLAALEELLGVKIPRWIEDHGELLSDTERALYDAAVVDAGPEGAWAVVEEYRRRKLRPVS